MSQRISRNLQDDINFGYGAVCKDCGRLGLHLKGRLNTTNEPVYFCGRCGTEHTHTEIQEATAKREAERASQKAEKAAQEDRRWENLSGGLTGD